MQILFSKPELHYQDIASTVSKEMPLHPLILSGKKRASSPGSISVKIKDLAVIETEYP